MIDHDVRSAIADAVRYMPEWSYDAIGHTYGCSRGTVMVIASDAGVGRAERVTAEEMRLCVEGYEADEKGLDALALERGITRSAFEKRCYSRTKFRRRT